METKPDGQESKGAGARRFGGGCHCGAVRFEVELDLGRGGTRCNCSVCTKTSVLAQLVKPDQLRLVAGEDSLGSYEWGAKISRRYFCRSCGVHCFGRGHLAEVGGDFASVNLNCVDGVDPNSIEVVYWDGRHDNWEAGPRKAPWPINS